MDRPGPDIGIGLDDLCEHIKGPDYPTDAEIVTPREDILKMYASGNGSIRMRARYEREDGDIVITADIPLAARVLEGLDRLDPVLERVVGSDWEHGANLVAVLAPDPSHAPTH